MGLIQLAVGVLAAGLVLALVIWARPHVAQWRQVRRFRKRLGQLELVTMIWGASVNRGGREKPYNNPA